MLQFFKNIKKNTWRYYFTSAYQKSWYDLQFLRHWAWWTEICNFRSLFAFFTPFKTKKITGYIIILLIGTKNPNQMMQSSWDTKQSETETIIVILGISCPFNDPENKILEKWKKMPGDINLLQMCTINDNHRCLVPRIWRVTDTIFYHFGSFFALPSSN